MLVMRLRVWVRCGVCALAGTWTAGAACGQNTVAMRSSVRLPRDSAERALVLHQIAEVIGPEAERLGSIVVESLPVRASRAIAGGRELELSAEAVRRTVFETPGVNPGRVSFSGGSCRIVFRDEVARESVAAMGSASGAKASPVDDGTPTVRSVIRGVVAARAGVPEVDVRVEFLPEDESALSIRQREGGEAGGAVRVRTIEAKVIGWGDRVPIAVTVYEKDRVIAQETVRVGVSIRRAVAIATRDLRRGNVINDSDVAREERWMDAGDEPAEVGATIGWGVRSRVAAGRVVMRGDLEPPIAVKKGELVRIDCVSGSLIVKTKGRAMASGKVGEVIRFSSPKDKTQVFEARLSGRGAAVLVASGIGSGASENGGVGHEQAGAPTGSGAAARLTGEAALMAAFERLTK